MPAYELSQFRGMILEEVLASLLDRTGYRIVSSDGGDSSLTMTGAGLAVVGRGAEHQIDVIADFGFVAPFSNPPRLLLEAKFWARKVDLGVVRNAVGVLRDASEWFLPRAGSARSRYHYQGAIFSVSGFSSDAYRYAYAHDIFLVPLASNSVFQPIIQAIQSFTSIEGLRNTYRLSELRASARDRLLHRSESEIPVEFEELLQRLDQVVTRVGGAYLARTSGGFPLFLVPESASDLDRLLDSGDVGDARVRYSSHEGWWLQVGHNVRLSFDLPEHLADVIGEWGRLDRRRAVAMKETQFNEIHAYRVDSGQVETLVIRLDRPWLQALSDEIG